MTIKLKLIILNQLRKIFLENGVWILRVGYAFDAEFIIFEKGKGYFLGSIYLDHEGDLISMGLD